MSHLWHFIGDKHLPNLHKEKVGIDAEDMKENGESSSNNSSASSPVHVYPVLPEVSGKTSPETSEFEKISGSVYKGTTSGESSDLEVINKSDIEDNH